MTSGGGWIGQFPELERLPPDLLHALVTQSLVLSLSTGSRIYGPGQAPQNYLLLLEGAIRVQQVSESGREIVLYRVTAGESCALTTASLMAYEDYLAEAIAETDIRAVAIPRATFDALIEQSAIFRKFVFAAFSARFTDLFKIIDQVAFARLDIRLAQRLLELSQGAASITVTQQQLASELGTAREVISRMLSEFHRRKWLSPARGSIAIDDRHALERLAKER